MTDRLIQIVTELYESGLTVEQQCLVSEMLIETRNVTSEKPLTSTERVRNYRERKRVERETFPVSSVSKEKAPIPPKENTPLVPLKGNISPIELENHFLSFWQKYPRKVGKGAARKAYRNACKRATPEEIAAGLTRYKPDPQFTKHASTWLNADCWLDEPDKKPNGITHAWKPFNEEMAEIALTPEERERRMKAVELLKTRIRPMQ